MAKNPEIREAVDALIPQATAADAVCRAVAANYRDNRHIVTNEDEFWTLVNTYGYEGFPDSVNEWQSKIGPHVFYPKGILAKYAVGQPIPTKAEAFPEL